MVKRINNGVKFGSGPSRERSGMECINCVVM